MMDLTKGMIRIEDTFNQADFDRVFQSDQPKEVQPVCHICGKPLVTADEIFSEECDDCFKQFVEDEMEKRP